jgi:MarR family transcriptional repressor of emrRAB
MHKRQRQANLLGAVSTAVAGRIGSATVAVAPTSGEGPAGLVALASFLNGGSIEELSRVLALSHSATVRLVDKLERGGMVRRRAGSDARTVALVPTTKGATVAAEIQQARLEAVSELLDPLSASEREQLTRLHEKLLAGVVATGESRGRICRLCDEHACGHQRGRCPVTEAPAPKPKELQPT